MHGKVQGTGAASDNGARGRCTGAREGAGRGPRQSARTVHGDGARVQGKVQGTGAERDNGARGRCTCEKRPGQSAIRVHGDGARVHGKVQEGDRGRAR